MGKAGRKVQTIELPERPLQLPSTHPRNFSVTTRNLCKSDLGGVIFGCKHETKDECLRKQLFGLTSFHYPYVKNVKQGLPLFLFNYSDRKLYGIYEAASHGQMNIDSHAWTEDDTETTKFPAQVRIHVKTQCVPLVEKQYYETLKDNYYTDKYFWFELDHTQTKGLIALFKPLPEPTGAVKRKPNSKPSVAAGNKNKFASLTWDDSCSSNICNSASEEGEIRESDSNQQSDLAGENVQKSHLDVSPHEGANQSSHGCWSETLTGAIEVGQHNEDVSEWGVEYPWKSMQHNSGPSARLNGENHDYIDTDAINESEIKGTDFGADWPTYCERDFEELPSCSNNLKSLGNADWTEVGAGKRKKKSKASAGSQNANKLASSTWDAGCSRNKRNSAPQERGIRNHISDRGPDWAGENVPKGHSGDSPYLQVASQWHSSWSKAVNGDSEEKKHFGDASEWEAEYPWQDMQHNSGVSAHLSEKCHDFGATDPVVERDFKDTVSDWEEDWSSDVEVDWSKEIAQDVPSYVCSHINEENESCLKQQSGTRASEIPLQNLQTQKGPSHKIFYDGDDTGRIQEEIRLPKEPDIVDNEKTTQELARDSHEESGLYHESANIAELEQNTNSPYLYDENAEWGQIIKVLKETTEALENKQVEADLELQELRNAIKESEKTVDELKAHVKELELTHSIVGTASSMRAKHRIGSEKVIYLIGGYDDSTCLSSLVSFSPSVDLVKPLKTMSSGRACASAAALNDNLYVFGGRGCSSSFDTVLCYSTKNDEWTSSPNLFCPKLGLAGATLDGKIYAIGGCYGSTYFSEVEMLDPALGRWTSLQPMLQKRFALAAAELHGVLYAVGGFDGRCYLQSVERYDPRVGRWMSLAGMKTSRGWHALAAFNEKIYAIGGHDGTKMLSSVETFEPRVGAWMAGEPLSVARGYSAAAVLDDSILVIGGKQDGDLDVHAAECYKEGTGWSASNFKSIGKMSYLSALVI